MTIKKTTPYACEKWHPKQNWKKIKKEVIKMNDKEIEQITEQVITEMLTESTGRDAMDSGGIYGRYWEENQKNGIKKGRQPVWAYPNEKEKTCELIPIIPIFDYLKNTVQYTEQCQKFESLLPTLNYTILFDIEDMIKNSNQYDNKYKVFQENTQFGSVVSNTYNDEDLLSQGFQYIWFEYENEDYIAISIHNGCDVRGGYTNIHIFTVPWAEDTHFARFEAFINCKCGMHNYQQLDPISFVYNNGYDERVNEKFIYAHSYQDENGNLRCKCCNSIIECEAREI